MQGAALDREFQSELTAIEQWFRTVSAGQQSVALHTLLQNANRAQVDLVNYALRQPDSITSLDELMRMMSAAEPSYRGVTFTGGREGPERDPYRPPTHRDPLVIFNRAPDDASWYGSTGPSLIIP